MNIPLIGGDKIRSLIKNATKDSSTGSNESLMKTNTRDSNNMIKDSDQLEMDRKNKVIMNNLKNSGGIIKKPQELIGGIKKSEGNNMGGGINVSQGGNLNNSEIKSRGLNIESGVNNVNDINNVNVNNNIEGIRINKNNGILENKKEGRINGGGGWGEVENSENSKKMTNALVDLYKVAGRLSERNEELDIDKLRNSFSEFENIGDDVLGDLVEDMKIMVKDKDMDLLKIAEAYPELGKINVEDLNDVSKAALINNMVESDGDKWGLVDWVLFAPNLVSESLGGKTMTEYLGDFGDWAYDKKKNRYTNEKEDEFIRNLQNEYREYMNENGEWLEPGGEKAKEFSKKLEQYTNKAGIGMGIDMVGNFVKGLPRIVDTAVNIVNHPGQFLKSITGMVSGLGQKGIEKVSEKKILGTDFLDNWAKKSGAESWQDLKETVWERAEKEGGVKSKVAAWLMTNEEIGDGMIDYFKENYGSAENLQNAIIERPEDVISDMIGIGQGAVGIARSAGIIDAARAEMIIKNLGKLDMYELSTNAVTKGVAKLGKGEINLAKKGLGKSMKGIEKGGELLKKSPLGKMGEFVVNKLTGLTEEERKFIRENGDIVDDYLKGNRSAEEIADLIKTRFDDLLEGKRNVGEFYNFIKNNENVLVKTNGIVSGIKGILSDLGIKIGKDGVLKFGELSFTPAQQKQLQGVYNYVKALENMGDSVSAKDVWRARQLIDTMANWEGNSKVGLDAEVMNNIRSMRGKIDDALKEQVAGFKDADSQYRELSNLVKELKKDWFTKEGNLKDNALSKIRNLTNKGNEAKLERLEKQFPGITNSLKGLGVSQSIEKASKMMVGQYAQQLLIGGGLWQLISGDLSIATALIGAGILTPKNLVKILKKEGNFMNKWKSIADKLSGGTALNKSNLDRLKRFLVENNEEIVEKVKEEEGGKGWEKVDMDKIDLEYDKAQREAYVGGKSTEKKLTKEERASLLKKYAKGSENNGFVMKIVDNMGEGTHGMADLDRKLVKLEENFGDTTAQHEFFHELFSVIDEDTKKYVINEVKNYLDLTDDVAAEERLAESFGIYARRKEIKLGNIRLKGNRLQRFQSKLRDLFQRAYEWIQDYSMDRKTINKLFNEVYGAVDGKVLDESGKFNLAEKLGINEKTPKLGVSENGLRYKKAGKSDGISYNEPTVKVQHDVSFEKKTPLTAVKGQNFNDSGLFGGNKDGKGNYIVKGGKNEQVIYTKVNKNGKAKFSGYKMELQEKNRKYYDNVVDALNRFEKKGYNGKDILIGKTPRGKDIFITDKDLVHIFKEHGEFYIENLIESVNDGRDGFWETKANKRYGEGALGLRPRMEIEIPGKNENFIVGLMSDGSDELNSTRYNVKSLRESKPSQVESRGGVRFKKDEKGLDVKDKQDGKIRYKRVWHGSPASFEKFDSSHMGEGEGAQAHGWGHYVAVDEKTGRKYAEMEKLANMKLDGRGLEDWINDYKKKGGDDPKLYARAEVAKRLEMGDGLASAKSMAKYDAEEFLKSIQGTETELDGKKFMHTPRGLYPKDAWDKAVKMYEDKIKAVDEITKDMWDRGVEGNRNLYEVEIPDSVKKDTPTGSNYLEEDGKITYQQIEKLAEGLVDYDARGSRGKDRFLENIIRDLDNASGGWDDKLDRYVVRGDMSGKKLYDSLVDYFGGKERGEKEASKFLESLGYDGIHYFGGRDGEAYVIFDDNKTQIKSHIRYKKDSTGRELSKGQQEYFKDSKVRDKNGNLIRVFKGVDDDFTVFDKNKIKEGSYFGDGIYFTDIKDEAESYGSKVMEGYLDIKKMFDFSKYYTEAEYNGLLKELGLSRDELQAYKADDGTYGIVSRYDLDSLRQMGEKNYKFNGKIITDALKKAGYDGIMGEVGDVKEFVVFDSNQFKNVDNLNPTKNADIRYKKDKLRPGEIDYGNKGLQYKGEISRGRVKEFLSKNMSKEELIRNIGRYDEAKKEFDVDLKKRAKELNGREVTTSIKMRNMDDSLREGGIKRIMEKQEKKGKIGGVRDIVRGTVIVEGKEGLKKALDKFYKEGQGVDDKYSFIGDNDMGYRDLSFVYYTKNGIPCEVQVNVPEMMVAKDGKNLVDWGFISKKEYDDIVKKAGVEGGEGHKMYEKYRNLNEERKGLVKLVDKKGEKNMRKEIERIRDIDDEMDRIEKESREYYKKFEDLIK